jgi:hypothetical protein
MSIAAVGLYSFDPIRGRNVLAVRVLDGRRAGVSQPQQPTMRVRDWSSRFENHRTRELRTLSWIPESTDLSSDAYATLLDHPDGPAHFGVAVALHIAASKGVPRGYLRREDGRPHDAQSLARLLRMPVQLVTDALARLIDIGELEIEKRKSRNFKPVASRNGTVISRDCAETSRNGAGPRGNPAPEGKGIEGKEQNGREEKESDRMNGTAESRENWGMIDAIPRDAEKRNPLRIQMARSMGRLIAPSGELETPDDETLAKVLAALGDRPIEQFCAHLAGLGGQYKPGGRGAPQAWGWFVSTARNWAKESPPEGGTRI